MQPESSYYKKDDPKANDRFNNTFEQLAEKLRNLHGRGIKSAYLHLDGWGQRGYDNLHPDVLPPAEWAGGWDGMKRLADTCREIDYVFALHDQYRDFYLDAPSFSEEQAIMSQDGSYPTDSIWPGGKGMHLCASLAHDYLHRNYTTIIKHGIDIKGVYLDVFAVDHLDECFNPLHSMTRQQCAEYRVACFGYIRSLGMIISSEEPVDYAIPCIDLVHHGPYATYPNLGGGEATGIPVPLFNLVYHDSIFLPWEMFEDGGWGIARGDACWLHALLNAGLPYLSVIPTEEELKKVKEVCDLNRQVGDLEMVNHEFIGGNYRKQITTFANGIQVEVDFDAKTYKIMGR